MTVIISNVFLKVTFLCFVSAGHLYCHVLETETLESMLKELLVSLDLISHEFKPIIDLL